MKRPVFTAVFILLVICTACTANNINGKFVSSNLSNSNIVSATERLTVSSQVAGTISLPVISSAISPAPVPKSKNVTMSSSKSQVKPSSSVKNLHSATSSQYIKINSHIMAPPPQYIDEYNESNIPYSTYPPINISDNEYTEIQNNGQITIYGEKRWVAVNQQMTLSKIIKLFKQSTPYTEGVPQSKHIISVEPTNDLPLLEIYNANNEDILRVCPAYFLYSNDGYTLNIGYIKDVLKIYNIYSKQTGYIKSSELYNWLKNDEYISECNSI